MKTLERFWQWFEAEKPKSLEAHGMAVRNLSLPALDEMRSATAEILRRALSSCDWGKADALRRALESYPEALRNLSIALLKARTLMRDQVPEAPRLPSEYEYEYKFPSYGNIAEQSAHNALWNRMASEMAREANEATAIQRQHAQPRPPEPDGIQVTIHDCWDQERVGITLEQFVNCLRLLHCKRVLVDTAAGGRMVLEALRQRGVPAEPLAKQSRSEPVAGYSAQEIDWARKLCPSSGPDGSHGRLWTVAMPHRPGYSALGRIAASPDSRMARRELTFEWDGYSWEPRL